MHERTDPPTLRSFPSRSDPHPLPKVHSAATASRSEGSDLSRRPKPLRFLGGDSYRLVTKPTSGDCLTRKSPGALEVRRALRAGTADAIDRDTGGCKCEYEQFFIGVSQRACSGSREPSSSPAP